MTARGWIAVVFAAATTALAQEFRVATYNVENFLDTDTPMRHAKPAAAREKVAESILALKPDVIALQEIGSTNVLLALQARLKTGGLDLPFWKEVDTEDSDIHLAVLSRFSLTERRPHTNESFLLDGRVVSMKRGFTELNVAVRPDWEFTLMTAHLKSQVPSPEADQAEWRYEEAKILRRAIDERLASEPNARLIVLGDFNDFIDSRPIRLLLGHGATSLFDTRPAERATGVEGARQVVWTDYYARQDSYSRIDYIFTSRAFKNLLRRDDTYVLNLPDWGVASDHRPLVAAFVAPTPR